jgi:hypothetical protein
VGLFGGRTRSRRFLNALVDQGGTEASPYFITDTVMCDGYCFEWCTVLLATTPFVSS